MEIVTEH